MKKVVLPEKYTIVLERMRAREEQPHISQEMRIKLLQLRMNTEKLLLESITAREVLADALQAVSTLQQNRIEWSHKKTRILN